MAAAVLLDHHSTTFTPVGANQLSRARTQHAAQYPESDESDNIMENDPDAAAELLRQKIEETN